MCVSRSTSGRARWTRSPRPVSVTGNTAWPRARRSVATSLHAQPPRQAPGTRTSGRGMDGGYSSRAGRPRVMSDRGRSRRPECMASVQLTLALEPVLPSRVPRENHSTQGFGFRLRLPEGPAIEHDDPLLRAFGAYVDWVE